MASGPSALPVTGASLLEVRHPLVRTQCLIDRLVFFLTSTVDYRTKRVHGLCSQPFLIFSYGCDIWFISFQPLQPIPFLFTREAS